MKLAARPYADALVISPAGRLDHDNCDAFRAALQPHLEEAGRNRQSVVLDLANLEYVSSAGLRCFVIAARQAGSDGGKVVLAALRPVIAEIFQISRFDMLFEIYPGVREALAALSPRAASAFDKA